MHCAPINEASPYRRQTGPELSDAYRRGIWPVGKAMTLSLPSRPTAATPNR